MNSTKLTVLTGHHYTSFMWVVDIDLDGDDVESYWDKYTTLYVEMKDGTVHEFAPVYDGALDDDFKDCSAEIDEDGDTSYFDDETVAHYKTTVEKK